MHKFMLILSLLLCFKVAFANDIKDIEVVDELPASLVKYRDYPWGLLKISKFRKKFNQVMKKSPEEKWVKEINLVANIGQAYRVDNHIVFCCQGIRPHAGNFWVRIIYDPVENNLLLRKEVHDMSFVSNYSGNVRIIDSVLYGDKYFYLTRLLDKNFGCWR